MTNSYPEKVRRVSMHFLCIDALRHRIELFPPGISPAKNIKTKSHGHSKMWRSQSQSSSRNQNQDRNQSSTGGRPGQETAVNTDPCKEKYGSWSVRGEST